MAQFLNFSNGMNYNINADIGESTGDDVGIIPLIQACNIACGGHAGSKAEIQKTIALAKEHNVLIGAHLSYADSKNFGRYSLKLSKKELYQSIEKQLLLILDQLHFEKLHHIKPHGALYHDCNSNEEITKTVLEVLKSLCPYAVIFSQPKSLLEKQALRNGFIVWSEAFIDRAYEDNGQLVSRSDKDAIIKEPKRLYKRFENLIQKKGVFSINNKWIQLNAKTICIHGDHPNAAKNLNSVIEQYINNYPQP